MGLSQLQIKIDSQLCFQSRFLAFSHSHILTFSHSHILTFSHSHILTFSHSHILTFSNRLIIAEGANSMKNDPVKSNITAENTPNNDLATLKPGGQYIRTKLAKRKYKQKRPRTCSFWLVITSHRLGLSLPFQCK
jgi:hypothetical protein